MILVVLVRWEPATDTIASLVGSCSVPSYRNHAESDAIGLGCISWSFLAKAIASTAYCVYSQVWRLLPTIARSSSFEPRDFKSR